MEPLPATANTGSEEFEDPHEPEDPDPTTHASIGAADGTMGSTDASWEAIRIPDSPATPRGGMVRAATAPGQPSDTARATGSAMDGPPPPQVMSPSLQMRDLEARVQQIRKDVDDLKDDDSLTQFATNVVNQMDGIIQQTLSMQDQIDRLMSKQPSTPETKNNSSTLT